MPCLNASVRCPLPTSACSSSRMVKTTSANCRRYPRSAAPKISLCVNFSVMPFSTSNQAIRAGNSMPRRALWRNQRPAGDGAGDDLPRAREGRQGEKYRVSEAHSFYELFSVQNDAGSFDPASLQTNRRSNSAHGQRDYLPRVVPAVPIRPHRLQGALPVFCVPQPRPVDGAALASITEAVSLAAVLVEVVHCQREGPSADPASLFHKKKKNGSGQNASSRPGRAPQQAPRPRRSQRVLSAAWQRQKKNGSGLPPLPASATKWGSIHFAGQNSIDVLAFVHQP
jgi:hypothetical protein